jgi:2-polyprenyl-3-methyl-5-hydroxy-6-metoxy-1,4-benzoquinol methylase
MESAYFDALYRADPDPWRFSTSDYERHKYAATLAALSRPRYREALEVGCSIGIFTGQLAHRCDRLLAIDGSAVALETARRTCASLDNVRFETRMVPNAFPAGAFDLIIFSEVLYYLQPADLERVADRCADALTPDGEVVLCHWLGETDYPLSGLQASTLFADRMLRRLPAHAILHEGAYRLDRLSARPVPQP